MGIEIERKFLLADESWKELCPAPPKHLMQGYFPKVQGGPTVRVRVADDRAFITVKGRAGGKESLERSEFEYGIPVADALAMMEEFCGSKVVEKYRYVLPGSDGLVWEIDEYLGANAGLFTAEIELPDAETPFERPAWLGEEVSSDSRYSNGSLSCRPYSLWRDEK